MRARPNLKARRERDRRRQERQAAPPPTKAELRRTVSICFSENEFAQLKTEAIARHMELPLYVRFRLFGLLHAAPKRGAVCRPEAPLKVAE
jgi:hypothetical protein